MFTRAILPAPSASDFDFPQLVAAALVREWQLTEHAVPLSPLTSPEIDAMIAINDPPSLSLQADELLCSVSKEDAPILSAFRVSRTSPSAMQKGSMGLSVDSKLSNREHKKIQMKAHWDLQQAKAAANLSYGTNAQTINKYIRPSTACSVEFDARNLKHTQFGWMGGRDLTSHQCIFSLEEMVGSQSRLKFTLQHWDGKYVVFSLPLAFPWSNLCRSSIPVTDHEDRVIAVLASSPDNNGWHQVHREAAEALEWSCDKLKQLSEHDLKHQLHRGNFPQEAIGESMGGGQKVSHITINPPFTGMG